MALGAFTEIVGMLATRDNLALARESIDLRCVAFTSLQRAGPTLESVSAHARDRALKRSAIAPAAFVPSMQQEHELWAALIGGSFCERLQLRWPLPSLDPPAWHMRNPLTRQLRIAPGRW